MIKKLIFLSLFLFYIEGKQMLHNSQVALNKLYDLQKKQFDSFNNYLALEAKRLDELNNYLATIYEWRHNFTENNQYIYLHDHINCLEFMSHVVQVLSKTKNLRNNRQSVDALNIIIHNEQVVDENDIMLAFNGIRRLQIFYDISASDMAAGFYKNRNIGDELDVCECHVILKYCLKSHDMYGVLEWANETYNKWIKNERPNCVDIDQLYLHTISSSMYTGLSFSPLYNMKVYSELKETQHVAHYNRLMKNDILKFDLADIFNRYNIFNDKINEKVRDLCKGGVSTRTLTKHLICQYNSKNSYFHKLMPFKEEFISDDPIVRIYHDVIYENEIENTIPLVLENMSEAQVTGKDTFLLNEKARSAQICFLSNEHEVKYLSSLNTRIELITKCTTTFAENYQIVNYGLGGHYSYHSDALSDYYYDPFFQQFGDRLVTVLFYLNDVLDDGFTSFPMLNVISPAEKRAALVFYNLHTSNGSLHEGSVHASCPVLKGNKWIMTKWLHEEGQDLLYNWKRNQ